MGSNLIQKESLNFLKKLSKNNNREWFLKHKEEFAHAQSGVIAFADELIQYMNLHDHIETPSGKKCLFRIYRDVRFSKDKTPFNTHWSGVLKRATKRLRGSYYFHIKPGNSFVMIGFWGPNTSDMNRLRREMELNLEGWHEVLNNKNFKKTFGELKGEQLVTAPRGYDKQHRAIHLLRYKQFLLRYDFNDQEVLKPDFVKKVNEVFKKARPFLDFMSEVLTTNADGESILD